MSTPLPSIPTPYYNIAAKRKKNVWYTIASGNWTDRNIWMSNSVKRWNYPGQNIPTPVFPQVGDDVYISAGHTVTVIGAANYTINNFYVSNANPPFDMIFSLPIPLSVSL